MDIMIDKRSEIDTRQPFGSVKEAVSLFGDKLLAGQIYSNKIKQMENDNGHGSSRLGTVTAELEETKLNLEKAKEETMAMQHCLSSLKQELQRTKKELQQLNKEQNYSEKTKIEFEQVEFQKKRYVTNANPPSLSKIIKPEKSCQALERHPSLKKKNKKPLIPFSSFRNFFSKKKQSQ